MTRLLAAGGAVLAVVVLAVLGYNSLIRKGNAVRNAWAQIDVQLRRRYDLIPNLVQTVKGYAGHERRTFEAVTAARTAALAASGPAARAQAEERVGSAVVSLLAVAEAYPELRADRQFLALQEELVVTENRIAYARQYYNDAVLTHSNAIQSVPLNLLAALARIRPAEYFRTGETERAPRPVDLS